MRTLTSVLLLVCTTPLLGSAQQATDPNAALRVRALENAWPEAEKHKDTFALDAMFDDGLVLVETDGTLLSKAEYLKAATETGSGVSAFTIEVMDVRAFGTTAIVLGVYRETGVRKGHAYVRRRRFVDTWALKNGKWICIAVAVSSGFR